MNLFALSDKLDLQIRCRPLDYLADEPHSVRWRAWWENTDERVVGIDLHCYPVVSLTPQGAWVDPYAYWHGEWVFSSEKRWVSNTGGQAWAKPTRQQALDSLAIRYERWAGRLARDIRYFRAAGYALGVLLPEKAALATRMVGVVAEAGRGQ